MTWSAACSVWARDAPLWDARHALSAARAADPAAACESSRRMARLGCARCISAAAIAAESIAALKRAAVAMQRIDSWRDDASRKASR